MANKKISELTTRTPSLSDLILVGDPSNGFSYKCTVSALATIIETDISDGYVTLGTTQTISGAKTFSNNLTLTSVANATTDPDKFLVLNGSNIVNYRTGSEVLSDIGGQATISLTTTGTSGAATFVSNTLNIPQYQGAITLTTTGTSGAATLVGNTLNIPNYAPDLSGYVPTSRTITINGTTQDLTANRTYNVGTVTSVAASAGTGISISGSPITSSGTITITNTAPDQVVALTAGTGISISGTYPNFTIINSSPSLGGTVTSVALSAPTGFAVTGSPITSSGTLALAFDTGYSLPTTASQTNWDTAYNNRITSLTTSGSSGSATLISNTLNIPTYTLAGLGGISLTSLSAVQPLSYNNGTGAFSISQSNTSTDGYLSFTDWNTFNGKIGGSGTTSYVPKFTSSTTIGDSQIYDNGTSVGINTASPNEKLEVSGKFRVSKTTSSSVYLNITAEGSGSEIIFDARGSSDQVFHTQTLERLRIGLGGDITISTIANATIDTDKFLVSDSGVIKYRTGSEILSDIGGQGALTLTTTGTSGAATLVGNTLNIPQYSGGGGTVSGTTNYIAKFTSSTAVGDSQIFDNGTNVGVATATAGSKLQVNGGAAIGYSASTAAPTNGLAIAGNVAIGTNTSTIPLLISTGNSQAINILTSASITTGFTDIFEILAANQTGGSLSFNIGKARSTKNLGKMAYFHSANGSNSNRLSFGFFDADNLLNLTAGGDLLIGTTTSSSKVSVSDKLRLWDTTPTNANATTIMGYLFNGAVPSGMALERSVNDIVSLGINVPQLGTRNNSIVGGIFRLDTRTTNQEFTVLGFATGGAVEAQRIGVNLQNGNTILAPVAGNVGVGISAYGTMGSKLQVNGNAAIGYSASTAAPTNGLAVAGGVTIGTGTNNVSSIVASGYSLTGANAQSLIDLAGTWNTTGNPAAIKLNITNTASGASAYLMDLQVGGATQFRVSKDGTIRTNTPTGGTAADWRLGRRVAATVALDTTQYIEVEVGGTLYRLGIVT